MKMKSLKFLALSGVLFLGVLDASAQGKSKNNSNALEVKNSGSFKEILKNAGVKSFDQVPAVPKPPKSNPNYAQTNAKAAQEDCNPHSFTDTCAANFGTPGLFFFSDDETSPNTNVSVKCTCGGSAYYFPTWGPEDTYYSMQSKCLLLSQQIKDNCGRNWHSN